MQGHKLRVGRIARVLQHLQVARRRRPGHNIKISVVIDIGKGRSRSLHAPDIGATAHLNAVEGIGGCRLRHEDRVAGSSRIEEVLQPPTFGATDQVEIAISVKVTKSRCAEATSIDAIEGVRRPSSRLEYWRGCVSGVLEIKEPAVILTHNGIEIAIIVKVGKFRRHPTWRREGDAGHHIGCAGLFDEGGCRSAPGILKIVQAAILGADDRIEVAIIVEIRKGWPCGVSNIEAREGIGSEAKNGMGLIHDAGTE